MADKEKLTKQRLQRGLKTRQFGKKMFVFETLDSTNNCARVLADAGTEEGTVVVSDFQTDGKGRLGREWNSEPGSNLLFSVLLRPSLPKDRPGILPFVAAVSIARSLESLTGLRFECKWPNDILLNGKKLCGILLESSVQDGATTHAILGVGLNVNQKDFPNELRLKATSLSRELKKDFNRGQILKRILEELEDQMRKVRSGQQEDIMSDWRSRSTLLGSQILVRDQEGEKTGTVSDILDDGGIAVSYGNGTRHILRGGDFTVLPDNFSR